MSAENIKTLVPSEFPSYHPGVFETAGGTLYLKEPGAVMVAGPAVNISGMEEMLNGFPQEYGFTDYLNDSVELMPGEQLVKTSGQVCYASYGEKRTHNEDAQRYIDNLVSSGHGSVLEHVNYSILFYGVSRSLTHELVRHRAGMAYSQLSQRYVSGRVLRFVERPEYQTDQVLHAQFEERIDKARKDYEETAEVLLARQQSGDEILSADQRTDRRKKVQQAARSLLPNETETVIMTTGNARAWRHVLSMRGSEHAEIEIRRAAFRAYEILNRVSPMLFQDFRIVDLPDGTKSLVSDHPKV